MTKPTEKQIEEQAFNCDGWPKWLDDLVEKTMDVADREDMSTEQAIAYAVLSAALEVEAGTDDKLFNALRDAYIRGAAWYRQNDDFGSLLYKAAYDYADKATSPLTTSPASSAVEGEAVATKPHNIYPISADPNIYTASSYANRSSGRPAPTPAGDAHRLANELAMAASLFETLAEDLPADDVSGIMMRTMAERNRAALPASPAPQTEGK